MTDIIDFIDDLEGVRTKAYPDSGGVWTIGIGSTYYLDGTPVKKGDVITRDKAYALAEMTVLAYAHAVKKGLTREVNKNQFTALTSFCYNAGTGAFARSVLLKMINANPNDPGIRAMFERSFITVNGVRSQGLVNRRRKEANKYFQ